MQSLSGAAADNSTIEIPHPAGRVRISMRPLDSVDESFERRWLALEQCAVEDNVFLSPHFALPAWRHRTAAEAQDRTGTERSPFVLSIEQRGMANSSPDSIDDCRRDDSWRLIGLGLFEECGGTTLLPLPMLKCWRSLHSYCDGLLIDRDHTDTACESFFAWLQSSSPRWHGVSFSERSADGPLADSLATAAERAGAAWHEDYSLERAAIVPDQLPQDCFAVYSRRRRQNFRRLRRRLADHGNVELNCHPLTIDDVEPELATFLTLEAAGWKGERGSALKCNDEDVAFLHDMIRRFSTEKRVILCRLEVNGEPVAASLNLQAGGTISGFKLGWAPAWQQYSPGIQCAIGLLESCRSLASPPALIDGCASPGGYLDSVWPQRRRLTTGVFASTMTGRLAADTLGRIKSVKRLVQSALS